MAKSKRSKRDQQPAEQTPAETTLHVEQHVQVAETLAETENGKSNEDLQQPRTSRSIVRDRFKKQYGALGGCGDDVGTELTAATTANVGGKAVTDMAKLKEIALQNGISQSVLDAYAAKGLNVGQWRMNIGNRLRAMVKRGEHVVIGTRTFEAAEDNTPRKAA